MVIFGARGDLAKRLLVPALYNLAAARQLSPGFRVLGVDHGQCDDAGFRQALGAFLEEIADSAGSEFGRARISRRTWQWLASRIYYQIGDFEDEAAYEAIGCDRLEDLAARAAVRPSSTWPWPRGSSATSSSGWTRRASATRPKGDRAAPSDGW